MLQQSEGEKINLSIAKERLEIEIRKSIQHFQEEIGHWPLIEIVEPRCGAQSPYVKVTGVKL